ncbi:hypothetical protein Anacy_3615 [Anabaena cylindrica PCC 7122]|uniref:Uncharacterized protein n=1 Tax=Anabaena cylindrica (strain ATCC 27899 / PCC 7122) TaxID=272123 RepID=K9ZIF1_ANACC|nr:hypothetical protein Anacy_3615 [Anabaena cylindrica PCC 7122]BAY03971.1 hypothetical protein NIES19_32270 [Anabaena cylindrica PCC 7122]
MESCGIYIFVNNVVKPLVLTPNNLTQANCYKKLLINKVKNSIF